MCRKEMKLLRIKRFIREILNYGVTKITRIYTVKFSIKLSIYQNYTFLLQYCRTLYILSILPCSMIQFYSVLQYYI